MKPLIYFICTSYLLIFNQFNNNITKVRIELTKLSELGELVDLGLKAEGYILNNKYWLVNLTKEELDLLKTTRFKDTYEKVAKKSGEVSFLFGDIQTYFNNCGYQLILSYQLSKKASFLSIQVFDTEGKGYIKKVGYNNPSDKYTVKLNSYNWPDGIYLLQLENGQQEKVQKVIQKNILTKKI